MFEVVPHGNGFAWRMIGACGRMLVERTGFPSDFAAADDAKVWRAGFWAHSCRVDHRMGACR